MEQTKTDFAALLGSAIAFFVAVWGVIFSPVTVDSVRPARFAAKGDAKNSDVADARLWDDPFVVFQDNSKYQFSGFVPITEWPGPCNPCAGKHQAVPGRPGNKAPSQICGSTCAP
jgi:hypothetical protein